MTACCRRGNFSAWMTLIPGRHAVSGCCATFGGTRGSVPVVRLTPRLRESLDKDLAARVRKAVGGYSRRIGRARERLSLSEGDQVVLRH